MHAVALVGRGIIGNSWALVFARAGIDVAIWDRTGRGAQAVIGEVKNATAAIAGTEAAPDPDALSRIRVHHDLATVLKHADYVQESVLEDLTLKQSVLRTISEFAGPDVIIASSTSGLLPSRLAETIVAKQRFIVAHPLTPPHLLPVTEIVPGEATSQETVERTCAFMRAVGQSPIRLYRETTGFAANRILAAVLNEYFHLIRDGVLRPEDADIIMTQGFGLRWACMGPFAAMDLNAPGGIADYLGRYGGILRTVAQERNASCGLDADVAQTVASAMRERHALKDHPARADARDRALAQLRAARTLVD